MTNQQTIAYENPCIEAEQCQQQRYRSFARHKRYMISVMLTVNVGEE